MGWTARFITEGDREFKRCKRLKSPVKVQSIYFTSYDVKGEPMNEVLEIYELEKGKYIVIRRDAEPTQAYFLVQNGKRKYSIPVGKRVNTAIEFMDKQGVEHVVEYIASKYPVVQRSP
jgi:hypothetical protein